MPRYYFDIIDQGIVEVDESGLELPDLAAAVEEAKRSAREIASDTIVEGSPLASVTIQVRDGPDTPIVTVLVRADAPRLVEVTQHSPHPVSKEP